MSKFSIEEKKKAVELVQSGLSIDEVARLTGISHCVIRRVRDQAEQHDWESLGKYRYDRSAEEIWPFWNFKGTISQL